MFGWTVEDLCGKSRRRPLVTARQIGMYVMRNLTDFSYPRIAEAFGGRDHTTVMYAVDKIKAADDRASHHVRAGQRADRPDPARQQWVSRHRPEPTAVDNVVEGWGYPPTIWGLPAATCHHPRQSGDRGGTSVDDATGPDLRTEPGSPQSTGPTATTALTT